MVIAAVLASGSGSRMNTSLPKQFISVCGKPILVYSIEAFIKSGMVDTLFVAVSADYLEFTEELLEIYLPDSNIKLISGGRDRHATLLNILKTLKDLGFVKAGNILLTHDAVRPFIDDRIICENISAAAEFGACTTAVSTVDTIITSDDGEFLHSRTDRSQLYNVQTPQSFELQNLYELSMQLSPADTGKITDATSIFSFFGEKVKLVKGKNENIKITYPADILFAEAIIKSEIFNEK